MKKSLYSLMLFDDVVDRIDEMAYLKNTNRSQLINDLLAQAIGLTTPEQKINAVIDNLSENLSERLTVDSKKVNNSITFSKSLKYKYRPKLNYTVDFYGKGNDQHAVLKVSSRSTSEQLTSHLERMFDYIRFAEAQRPNDDMMYGDNYANYVFIRHFPMKGEITKDSEQIADNLTSYINQLDRAVDRYFCEPENEELLELFTRIFDI